MKIMIFGGAGFVGSHLCDKYIKNKDKVICFDNLSNGNLVNIRHLMGNPDFRFVYGDIRDKTLVEKNLQGVDAVFILAACIHVDKSLVEPQQTFDVNVNGTLNILEACKLHDIKKIVYASTSEVYGSAQTFPMNEDHPLGADHVYGVSKIAAERLCYSYHKMFGMPISIARCFNIFGSRQRDTGYGGVISIFVKRVLAGQPPIVYGDGEQTRDYMYVKDAVEAYDVLLNSSVVGVPINFGTGRNLSINEIARLIIKECGSSVVPVHVEARPNEVQNLVADVSKAKKLLDWKPRGSFERGLKEYVDWFRNFKGEEWKIT